MGGEERRPRRGGGASTRACSRTPQLANKLLPGELQGFYRVVTGIPETLVIGPYQGTHGCLRIPFARGVCGAAARTKATVLVDDVEKFPGHIACSSRSPPRSSPSASPLASSVACGRRCISLTAAHAPPFYSCCICVVHWLPPCCIEILGGKVVRCHCGGGKVCKRTSCPCGHPKGRGREEEKNADELVRDCALATMIPNCTRMSWVEPLVSSWQGSNALLIGAFRCVRWVSCI